MSLSPVDNVLPSKLNWVRKKIVISGSNLVFQGHKINLSVLLGGPDLVMAGPADLVTLACCLSITFTLPSLAGAKKLS